MRPNLFSATLVLLVCGACSQTGDKLPPPPPPPTAPAVSYNWIGNANLAAPAAEGIVARAGGTAFSVLPSVNQSSTAGGLVNINPDGSFNYEAPHLFTGPDTFTYARASDGAIGTVTIAMPTRAWFVDADPAVSGDGTMLEPFNTLAAAEAQSLANDTIFIYSAATALPGGITLKAGQQLIGELMGLSRDGIVILPPGTMPAIDATTAAGATLAAGAHVAGLQFVATTFDALVVDLGGSATVSFDTISILGPGTVGRGLALDVGAGETLTLTANGFFVSGTLRGLVAAIAGDANLTFDLCSFGANTLGEMQVACTGSGTTNLILNAVTFNFDFGAGAEFSTADDANLNVNCATGSCTTLVGASPMWFQTTATGSSSLALSLLDVVMSAGKSTPVSEFVHMESSGTAMTQLLVGDTSFDCPGATAMNVINSNTSLFNFLVMSSDFTNMGAGLNVASSGISCTGTMFDCSMTNVGSLVNINNTSGLLVCGFDQVTSTAAALSGITINSTGNQSSVTFNACSLTGGNGGAIAMVDTTTVSSHLLVQNCDITNNGALGCSILHNGMGTACVDIHGTQFGRTNGLPSHIMISNPGAAGPLNLVLPNPANTALPGSMQLLFGAISSVTSCSN